MTLEDALLRVLEHGEDNPREIAERLEGRVREALNRLADDGKINRRGYDGRGNEKRYSLKPEPPLPTITRRI
ncbi:MAG: hypothetical protein WAV18_12255 [Roseiarcus sp.]